MTFFMIAGFSVDRNYIFYFFSYIYVDVWRELQDTLSPLDAAKSDPVGLCRDKSALECVLGPTHSLSLTYTLTQLILREHTHTCCTFLTRSLIDSGGHKERKNRTEMKEEDKNNRFDTCRSVEITVDVMQHLQSSLSGRGRRRRSVGGR